MLAPKSAAERGLAYLDPSRSRATDPGQSAATYALNPTDRPLPFRTARQIAEETPEETQWIVPGYLAEGGISEFDGKVKAGGKTTLLTHMARSIVDGDEFLGQPTKRTGVVYLTEQPSSSFRRSLGRAGLLDRDDFHVLYWAETRDWSWPVIVKEATLYAKSVGAKVLIVDTLPQWAGLQGDSENNSGAALAAVAPLQEAAALHNLAVAVVRHERKGSGEVGESARGSSAFAGAVDIIVQIKRGEGNSRPSIRILSSLSRYDETPDELVIDLTEAGYVVVGDRAAVAEQEARWQILDMAPDNEGDALATKDLIEKADVKPTVGKKVLNALKDEGILVCIGRGVSGDPHRYFKASIS